MSIRRRWERFRTADPARFDALTVVGAGAVVLVVALWQFGLDADGAFRGLSLGTWMAVAVAIMVRRRRAREARASAERAEAHLELARELHDSVAGRVAAIGLQAAGARRVLESRPDRAAEALVGIETEARAANAELRRMLDELRGRASEEEAPPSGLARVADLVDTARRSGAIRSADVEVDPRALALADRALDRAAFRIVEEGVRNAAIHAGGSDLRVRVAVDRGILRVEVENGPPPHLPAREVGATDHTPGSGLGLVGMRERAALRGGTVDAGATSDGGFLVLARLPLHEQVTS
jgi:signal transduction histidine kinase